jgi:hypothetical protein
MVAYALALLMTGNPVVESHRIASLELPTERVTGVAFDGHTWLVGGLRGIFRGKPDGAFWTCFNSQAVKSIETVDGASWVIYGNGAVDKIVIDGNKLYFDVFQGAKRPWTCSMTRVDSTLYFGGQGGWLVKSPTGDSEQYPPELKGLPVNAMTQAGGTLWMGTQDGVFAYRGGRLQRFGFGSGLHDIWVTAMVASEDTVVVGLAAGGLARISGDKAEEIPAPTKRVRSLYRWKGSLVLGSLDGTWLRQGTDWLSLLKGETYFIGELGPELVVGDPSGLHFFRYLGS